MVVAVAVVEVAELSAPPAVADLVVGVLVLVVVMLEGAMGAVPGSTGLVYSAPLARVKSAFFMVSAACPKSVSGAGTAMALSSIALWNSSIVVYVGGDDGVDMLGISASWWTKRAMMSLVCASVFILFLVVGAIEHYLVCFLFVLFRC